MFLMTRAVAVMI